MKKYFSLIAALILLFACQQTQDKKRIPREVNSYTVEQFMDNENVFGGSFSPDKSKLLITSNNTGIYNVYTIPAEGGEYTAISNSDTSSVYGLSFFPEDERILFNMDNNGDEVYHIYMKDLDGEIKELTSDKGARAIFYGWAYDKTSFFYGYNNRDQRFMDIYQMDIESFESKLIYQNDDGYNFGGISNDQKYLALTKSINTNDNNLFIYYFETKEMTKVNEELSSNSPQDFGLDNKYLFYTTDLGSEFSYLVKYDIASKEKGKVLKKEWDIAYAYFSYGGKYMVSLTNEDGKNVVEVKNTQSGEYVDFPKFESGDVSGVRISRDETIMSFYVASSNSPANLYIYNVETKEYKQLTDVLNKEINKDDMVTAEVVRFNSFDEVEIPAIYYIPHQASIEKPVPALVWVHGGPGGQSRQSYRPLLQYLVNHGYAVLAVNNRGSSGYGKTFYQMDDLNHGDKDLKDCIAGKEWLMQQAEIDSTKIGIIGGSYGGFMVMAALTFTPEEFDVGVNLFGVTNWIRTTRNIPPWWEAFKEALYKEMGDPFTDDSVRLYNISPLFHAEKVTKPLMVLQGAQDPRVIKAESDEIVEAVKKNDVPVEYVLFEDEGHGFVKKENQIEANGKILKFLDKYLKGIEE